VFFHVVLMRFAEDAGAEVDREVEAYAARVRRECVGLLHYDFAVNVASRAQGFDRVILAAFESGAAHDAYQVSPVHQEMKARMGRFIADILVSDSELEPAKIPGPRR
jgi:quinol monooxygenase YgiN